MSFNVGAEVRVRPGEADEGCGNQQGTVNSIKSEPPVAVTAVTGGQPMAELINKLAGGTDLYEVILQSGETKWFSEDQLENVPATQA